MERPKVSPYSSASDYNERRLSSLLAKEPKRRFYPSWFALFAGRITFLDRLFARTEEFSFVFLLHVGNA